MVEYLSSVSTNLIFFCICFVFVTIAVGLISWEQTEKVSKTAIVVTILLILLIIFIPGEAAIKSFYGVAK